MAVLQLFLVFLVILMFSWLGFLLHSANARVNVGKATATRLQRELDENKVQNNEKFLKITEQMQVLRVKNLGLLEEWKRLKRIVDASPIAREGGAKSENSQNQRDGNNLSKGNEDRVDSR